jgi:hypothetical protein
MHPALDLLHQKQAAQNDSTRRSANCVQHAHDADGRTSESVFGEMNPVTKARQIPAR